MRYFQAIGKVGQRGRNYSVEKVWLVCILEEIADFVNLSDPYERLHEVTTNGTPYRVFRKVEHPE